MSKKFKKLSAIVIAVSLMASTIAGCGSSGDKNTESSTSQESTSAATTEAIKTPDPVTLEFFMPSPNSTPNDMDLVLDEFYKQTKDTLNITINFNFTTFDDIGKKVNLRLAAGQQMDSAFLAQWTAPSIMQAISKGQLANLDGYFNSDTYPGLKKAFTQDYLKNNSFIDTKGESHVYGIPFTHSFDQGKCFYYRKDLAEKYGIEVKTLDDLTKFFDAVLKNEEGMVPLAHAGATSELAEAIWYTLKEETPKHNFSFGSSAERDKECVVKEDGTAYVPKTILPMLDPEFTKQLPAPLNTVDPLREYKVVREWYTKGYLQKDILSVKEDEPLFKAGKAAAYWRGIDTYNSIAQEISNAIPGGKVGYLFFESGLRTNTPKQIGSSFQAWNFACIPSTSKNVDRTMQFFNWLYEDQANVDLFELGIEGKHWIAEGTSKFKLPEGIDATKNYNFPAFTLSWNPTMQRYSTTTPDEVVDVMNKLGDTNFLYKSLLSGYNFDSSSVKSEMSKLNDIATLRLALGNGVVADIDKEVAELQKKWEQAGGLKVAAEKEKQLNAFLKEHPYEGQ